MYASETSKHRDKIAPFCTGYGLDIGFGGDPVVPTAIRLDLPRPYAETGDYGVQLGGDCTYLSWFRDECVDYVYSSHVLEDFPEDRTVPIMLEWARPLQIGGRLILLLPDQQAYLAHCHKTGQPVNEHHSIEHFSCEYILQCAERTGCLEPEHTFERVDEYSFLVVLQKCASASAISTPGNLPADIQGALDTARRNHEVALHRLRELEKNLTEARAEAQWYKARWDRIKRLPGYNAYRELMFKMKRL